MNKVLFFAHLRDAVGEESLQLNAAGKTIAEVKQQLTENYHLQNMEGVMAAINEEFSSDDEMIQEGDTIAFIPPVSGG